MKKFTLKSGNTTFFKKMGSSPAKQAIGGDAGEAVDHWKKYKSAKAQDAAVNKLATNKNISKKAFDTKLANITKTVNPHSKAIKAFSNTPTQLAKGGKEILKTTTRNLVSGGKQVINTAKNVIGKAGKFFGGKTLGIIPMMIATSSKADQPTKSQGGGQMDPNWLKK